MKQQLTEIELEDYTKGFNDSYLLAAHDPQLLADITPEVNEPSTYFIGFFAGKDQYQLEQELVQLDQLREQDYTIEKDLDEERERE